MNVGSKSVCEVNSKAQDKSIRLVGNFGAHLGAIEVFHNSAWGGICFDNFYAAEGHVACRDLGYSGISNYASVRYICIYTAGLHLGGVKGGICPL